MADHTDPNEPRRGRSAARRALRGAAAPLLGYFDRRFQDIHDHVDEQPHLDARFEQLLLELRQTRDDVAADTDTIAELAFTLERFADLFTARMEDLAAAFATPGQLGGAGHEPATAALPFAYAAAGRIAPGSDVVTIGDQGPLSHGLAVLGLRVTALEPAASLPAHPEISVVDAPVDEWAGPGEPLDAVFSLAPGTTSGAPTREALDLFRKWLAPTGMLVVASALGPGDSVRDLLDHLADWEVEREDVLERDAAGSWRRRDPSAVVWPSQEALALIKAVPRP